MDVYPLTTRRKMIEDLFSFDVSDILGDDTNIYFGPVFKRDFGPFNQGEKFKSLTVDLGKGKIEAWDESRTAATKSCGLKLVAVPFPTTATDRRR